MVAVAHYPKLPKNRLGNVSTPLCVRSRRSNDNVVTVVVMLGSGDYMRATEHLTSKREALNPRIKPEVRELIDRAAELAGKNRTDFVLDAARARPKTRCWIAPFLWSTQKHIVNS